MKDTRQSLEGKGFTFHPGSYHKESGRFVCSDMASDHTPPYLDTLLASGYILVPGGIMEPPSPGILTILGGAALIIGGAYALNKVFKIW